MILNEIVRRGSITGSELAKNISLSPATVTDIVKRLEQKELLIKQQDEVDKRKFHLMATDQDTPAASPPPDQDGEDQPSD